MKGCVSPGGYCALCSTQCLQRMCNGLSEASLSIRNSPYHSSCAWLKWSCVCPVYCIPTLINFCVPFLFKYMLSQYVEEQNPVYLIFTRIQIYECTQPHDLNYSTALIELSQPFKLALRSLCQHCHGEEYTYVSAHSPRDIMRAYSVICFLTLFFPNWFNLVYF